jgi:hypothetical protein
MFGSSVARGAAVFGLVLVQSACASTQQGAAAPKAGEAPAMTIADASAACASVQANARLPVSCATEYIENVPAMIVGFRNVQEAQEWLRPFAEQVGGPFCDAANRSGREARVYMTVGTEAGERARRWNCELGKWGEWFATAAQAATPSAPEASAPAASAPAPEPASPGALGDAVSACNTVQADPNVPMSCVTKNVDGIPAVIVSFPTADDANTYMEQVAQKVARPFCDAANRAGQRASFFITLAGTQARHYDCQGQRWSEWFELPQTNKPARTAI